MPAIIVAHGGVGSPVKHSDGPLKAIKKASSVLRRKGSVLDAAVTGVMVLEDDPRFNAGTGSSLRFDGSIQMDAAVMDSEGNFGAVAGIQLVKNPVLVARRVMNSPHVMLCADGATQFARAQNFPFYNPVTPRAKARLELAKAKLKSGKVPNWIKRFRHEPWKTLAGGCDKAAPVCVRPDCRRSASGRRTGRASPAPMLTSGAPRIPAGHRDALMRDTVGIVVSDGKGNFAAAGSTGGTSYMLPGRIGDTPIIGCGIYAGKKGAVVATGIGEEIIKNLLSKEVYEKINRGLSPQQACEWGLTLFERTVPIGVIAVTLNGYGLAASHQMAYGYLQ